MGKTLFLNPYSTLLLFLSYFYSTLSCRVVYYTPDTHKRVREVTQPIIRAFVCRQQRKDLGVANTDVSLLDR